MKTITTAVAVLLATILMTACGKKESAAPAEAAPAATAAPAEAAAPAATPEAPANDRGRSGDGWRQSRAEVERGSAAPIELTAQGSEFFFGSSFIAWLIQSRKLSTRV